MIAEQPRFWGRKPSTSHGRSRLFRLPNETANEAHRSELGKALQSVVPSLKNDASRPTTCRSARSAPARSARPGTSGLGNDASTIGDKRGVEGDEEFWSVFDSGVSPPVQKRNCSLERPLRMALEDPKQKNNKGEEAQLQPEQLEEIGHNIDTLGKNVVGIHKKHRDFVADNLARAAAENALLKRKKSKEAALHPPSTAASSSKPRDEDGTEAAHANDIEVHPSTAPADNRAGDHFPGMRRNALHKNSAMPADSVAHLEQEDQKRRKGKSEMRSKQQEEAMEQFDLIQAGQADAHEVFGAIWHPAQRMQTRLDFYRSPRPRRMLPKLDQKFMRKESQMGNYLVDAPKLAQHVECGLPLQEGLYKTHEEDEEGASPCKSACTMPRVLSTEELWKMKGLNHDESLATFRSAQEEHLKRINRTVNNAKRNLHDRRLEQLKSIKQKESRHANCDRDRALLTWMALAMFTDTVYCTFATMKAVFDNVEETDPEKQNMDVNVRTTVAPDNENRGEENKGSEWNKVKVHLQKVAKVTQASKMLAGTAMTFKKGDNVAFGKQGFGKGKSRTTDNMGSKQLELVQKKMEERRVAEELKAYKNSLYWQWKHLTRVHIAIVRLKRPLYMNRKAEIMKDFINQAWRGYTIRAGVKNFLRSVGFLQRAIRSYCKLKKHIIDHIIAPACWQEETRVLAEIVGMAPASVEQEIEASSVEFEIPKQLREAQKLMDARRHIWRGEEPKTASKKGRRTVAQGKSQQSLGARRGVNKNIDMSAAMALAAMAAAGPSFDHSDEPSPTSPTSPGRPRIPHPMMQIIDKHRLSRKFKQPILEQCFSDSLIRWWNSYQKYKRRLVQFNIEWQQWRIECAALGPYHRASWPPCPAVPIFPQELTKIDRPWLHDQVMHSLKRHSLVAGGLL